MWFWIIFFLVVGALVYVRLAPVNEDRVHVPISANEDEDGKGHCLRVTIAFPGLLKRIDEEMRALPRTTVIAGSLSEKRITYMTRSKVFAFPDFTTVQEVDDQIRLYARLRFGRSDIGVNKARLKHVLRKAIG